MLKREMERQGQRLFRWRSYLPLALLPLVVLVFLQSGWMESVLGEGVENAWDFFCLAVALSGLAMRAYISGHVPAGTSGRNTKAQKADVLNTTGVYSLMRHPLYFANFIGFIAMVLLVKSIVFTLFAATAFFLYYERIVAAEESFLESKYGTLYREWAARTPAFFPPPSRWVAPTLPFSWRAAVNREFHGLLLIATVFFISELSEATVLEHRSVASWMHDEPFWILFFAASAIVYLAMRVVRKQTTWLVVPGR
jgi:protein-S-isoprenylcysteine O-methyltransferase Ste14